MSQNLKKYKKRIVCSVINCRQHREAKRWPEPLSFHEIPADLARREKWLQALGREHWRPRDKARICSVHFLPDDYRITETNRKLLKTIAVPSQHLQLSDPGTAEESGSDQDKVTIVQEIPGNMEHSEETGSLVNHIIIVDLANNKKPRTDSYPPDSLSDRDSCTACLELKKELREVEFQLSVVRRELAEQKKLVEEMKNHMNR